MPVCENVQIWVSLQVFLKSDPSMRGSHMVSIPRPFALPVGPGEAAVSQEFRGSQKERVK